LNDVYEEPERPASVGQVREKTYRFALQPEAGGGEVWVKRFQDYWERQEKRFGIEFRPQMVMGVDREAMTITSQVMVQRILPGRRTPKEARHNAPVALQ
jgi:hypothetical protein